MQQNATLKLDGADAGTMNVGSNGARRSALTPDEWVEARPDGAAAAAPESSSTRRARATDGNGEDGLEAALVRLTQASRGAPSGRGARDLEALLSFALEGERRARDNALKTATALDSVARWIERTEDRMAEAARTASEGWQRAAAALQAVETFEGRLSKAEQTSLRQEPIASVLRDLQDRIVKLDERLSAMPARPIGRRGLDARDEVKNAIAEIKARQSELEAAMDGASQAVRSAPIGSDEDALRALNDDIARLTGQLETVQSDAFDFDASAIEAVRDEVGRLRASLAGVATRDDVTALERSVLHFAERVAQARSQGDMTGVKAPLEDLQNEVRRLSEAVASGLPRRLTGELEQLAGKIDAISQAGVDPAVVGTLSRDIGEMRRVLSGLAEPRRIQDLSRVMTELSAQVAEIAARQVDAVEFSSLKASVEDIRAALKGARPEVRGADYTKQFVRLSQDIERLSRRVHELAPGGSGPVESGALLQRLDRLDESLRPPVRGDALKPI